MDTWGVLHGADDAVRLDLARQVEERVHRGHHHVELGQGRIGQVEPAVLEDVDLDALEDRRAGRFFVQPVDFPDLARHPARVEAMGHGDAPAMVGERDILVTELVRRLDHGLDGRGAVGPVGMDMKIAAQVRQGHEVGQLVGLGQRDLAAVLAQLRRDEGESQLLVDLFLGGAGNPPLPGEQAVFVEFPAAVERQAAQRDVVGLRSGEIEQRGTIALLRHGAQIDLEAGP